MQGQFSTQRTTDRHANDATAQGSALVRQALAAYVLLVIYASLHPFSGWTDPGVPSFAWLTAPWPRYWTVFDLASNVVGYFPLGFLIVLALWPRLRGLPAVAVALVASAAASTCLEALQVYLPSRVASNVDLACNSAGALAGALAGAASAAPLFRSHGLQALRYRTFRTGSAIDLGLVLVGLWLFSLLNPETLLYGNGDLRGVFQAADGEHHAAEVFIRFEASVAAANVLAIGLIAATLTRRGQPARIVILLLVLASLITRAFAFAMLFSPQDFLLWATPGALFGIAGGTLAAMIAVGLPGPARLALAGLALMAATAVVNLAPDNPYLAASLAVWPQGQFLHFNGITRVVSVLWPFAALSYLMWLAAGRRGAAV
jgi:VanZ family protein